MPPPSKIGPPVVASCIDVSSSFFDGLAPILEQLEAEQLEGPNAATRRCNSDARNQYRLLERSRKGPHARPSLRKVCVSDGGGWERLWQRAGPAPFWES